MKDFLQTLLGIIIVGAVSMALILYFFPNPEALGMSGLFGREMEPIYVEAPADDSADTGSFAQELLPPPPEEPVYEPISDELLTGEQYNRPKAATPNMFDEAMRTVTASAGNTVAPSRIVVQKEDGTAYVWSEFEYDPQGNWMKQRIYPLREGENTLEILYNRYGSITKAGIARKQLLTYDKGFPSEGIGMDREGRYRYFQREDTTIAYDTDLLYFLNHTDKPLYKVELTEDLVTRVREEKYYERRIRGGAFFIFQHRVIDAAGLVRRIVDFSKLDNEEPLIKEIREYDEQERLLLHRTYDSNRNITQEESFTYNETDGSIKEHTLATRINGILIPEEVSLQEGAALLTGSESVGKDIRYADYFDRPNANTVRRLSVNETDGTMEETTYQITRDSAGNVTNVNATSGETVRTETWDYDGNGNWISYRVKNGQTGVFQMQVSYRETAFPYNKDVFERRILSLEPMQFAAFLEEPKKDTFWWCSPACSVEERFVLSGLYY